MTYSNTSNKKFCPLQYSANLLILKVRKCFPLKIEFINHFRLEVFFFSFDYYLQYKNEIAYTNYYTYRNGQTGILNGWTDR